MNIQQTRSKVDVLLGLQWGDEGKGKIVDVLTPQYDVVARFQGGPNAGHTLEFNGKKFVLHTIPSGIFHSQTLNLIGNGVVLDPVIFQREIAALGLDMETLRKNLLIARKAHLILPSHRLLDAANEAAKGTNKIGSTLKGIGPAYTDKIARCGLRVGDIEDINFKEKVEALKQVHLRQIDSLGFDYSQHTLDNIPYPEYETKWFQSVEELKKLNLVDGEIFINNCLNEGKKVLAEGAQGSLLDIDFGSYPFVTSSNTIAAGACSGLGIAPSAVGRVFGIFKAYCTRVGSGPFPTELFDEEGQAMRKEGNEFGSTTGRPRRCGWLDLPALKYSIMINGVTSLFMTKADVLSIFEQIKVCTAYDYQGATIDYIPFNARHEELKPVLENRPGWKTNLKEIKDVNVIPSELKHYVDYIEAQTGVSIDIISIGPDREQTLMVNPLF